MLEFSDKALILKIGRIKESDLWIRFLSANHGIFTAFAFGGSKSRHRFCGCLDILNQVLIRVSKSAKGKEYLSLEESTLLQGVSRLRRDRQRLGMAINCLKFIEAFQIDITGAKSAHSLFLDLLDFLENSDSISNLLPIFFRLRFISEQGFSPQLQTCYTCGKELNSFSEIFFYVKDGAGLCSGCADIKVGLVRVNNETLSLLQVIQTKNIADWFLSDCSGIIKEQFSRVVENFIEYHIGVVWENWGFKKY